MLPIVVTQTGVGASRWVNVSPHMTPTNISIGCVVTGTVTYNVEYTYTNPNGDPWAFPVAPVTPTVWIDPVITAQTGNKDTTYSQPIACWRVNITAGTGTVTATAIQAGISGP